MTVIVRLVPRLPARLIWVVARNLLLIEVLRASAVWDARILPLTADEKPLPVLVPPLVQLTTVVRLLLVVLFVVKEKVKVP